MDALLIWKYFLIAEIFLADLSNIYSDAEGSSAMWTSLNLLEAGLVHARPGFFTTSSQANRNFRLRAATAITTEALAARA